MNAQQERANVRRNAMRSVSDVQIARAMRHAESTCREHDLAFTPLRREVFELVCRRANPAGAYELLHELKTKRPKAAPVTVYRALEFLMAAGLVHRVAALNAFTACDTQEPGHGGLLLVCGQCCNVIELDDPPLERRISESAAGVRFETSTDLVEVRGLCADCRANDAER